MPRASKRGRGSDEQEVVPSTKKAPRRGEPVESGSQIHKKASFPQVGEGVGDAWNSLKESSSPDEFGRLLLLVRDKMNSDSGLLVQLANDEEKFKMFSRKTVNLLLDRSHESPRSIEAALKIVANGLRHIESSATVLQSSLLRFASLPIWGSISKSRLQRELSAFEDIQKKWAKYQSWRSQSDLTDDFERDESFLPFLCDRLFADLASLAEDVELKQSCICSILDAFVQLLCTLTTKHYVAVLLDDKHVVARLRLFISKNPSDWLREWIDILDSYLMLELQEEQDMALELQRVAFSHFPDTLKDISYAPRGSIIDSSFLTSVLQVAEPGCAVTLAKELGLWSEEDDVLYPGDDVLACAVLVDKVCKKASALDAFVAEKLYPTERVLFDDRVIPSRNASRNYVMPLPKLGLKYINLLDFMHRCYKLYALECAYEIGDDLMDAIQAMQPKQATSGAVGFSGWSKMATPVVSRSIGKVTKPKVGEKYPAQVTASVTIDLASFTADVRNEWEELRENDVVFLVVLDRPCNELTSTRLDTTSTASFQQFVSTFGVKHVRGAEIIHIQDEANNMLNAANSSLEERQRPRVGTKRQLYLDLDPRQYLEDVEAGVTCYEHFNLLIRRNARENTFKAVLQTIRSLGHSRDLPRYLPPFMRSLLLGQGDPRAATCYWNMLEGKESSKEVTLDMCDTFTDLAHVRECFPGAEVTASATDLQPPFTLTYTLTTVPPAAPVAAAKAAAVVESAPVEDNSSAPAKKATRGKGKKAAAASKKSAAAAVTTSSETATTPAESVQPPLSIPRVSRVQVQASPRTVSTPYAKDPATVHRPVRFTPRQVEAIRLGMQPGLSMIVGPPGTGKTDLAVQLIANLYTARPTERILIVTHSNAALNDLFAKIMQHHDIDPRHLLRLGSGERELRDNLLYTRNSQQRQQMLQEQLALEHNFSKVGRVNWSLSRRLQLLADVQRLAQSLGIQGDYGVSCEVAEYLYAAQIQPRIAHLRAHPTSNNSVFPFSAFFGDLPAETLSSPDTQTAALRYLEGIFSELREFRAYELLRTQTLRADYLLTTQARIVAMTCKHAAIMRNKLVEQGFRYDSLIVEEAAQILEIETLIPMLLQAAPDPLLPPRLQRLVLLGDHQQLPPIVRHPWLRSSAVALEQSMFSRFIALGVPHTVLDVQGRARPALAQLYAWKYPGLGHLPQVTPDSGSSAPSSSVLSAYRYPNAGFVRDFQFVDVGDFQGRGEQRVGASFQNLGEAEYVVACYQYMRLLGYPAERIVLLTTYSAQRQLLMEVLQRRCARVGVFGLPASVATVDRYQGQQSDYVLLSLVRSQQQVGHLQDVRRLIVAISRARLGLYIFGRQSLFFGSTANSNSIASAGNSMAGDMRRVWEVLGHGNSSSTPQQLQLVAGEAYPLTAPRQQQQMQQVLAVQDVTAMGVLVYQMVQQSQPATTSNT